MIRTTPVVCSTWLPLSAVSRSDLAFLSTLGGRVEDARMLGTLVRPMPEFKREPLAGVRVEITNGPAPRTATTDRNGRFEGGALRRGTTTSVPSCLAGSGQ